MDSHSNFGEQERLHLDTDHICKLVATILPVAEHIHSPTQSYLQTSEQQQALAELITALHELHPADMATLLESLPLQERMLVWKLATPTEDGEVLLEVSDPVRETLIENMAQQELLAAVDNLDADELAQLAPDLPKEVVYEAISSRDEEERAQITAAMSFEDNQVGALMDFELVSIRADVTCEVVLRYLRRFERLPDHTDKIFVVDNYDVLQGVLPIRSLLVADPDLLVSAVMADDVVTFRPEDDAEEAAAAFERYDLVTAPVVDSNRKLIGRITVDEMVDVIREESETDMLNMAGLREEEDLFAPVVDSVKNRWIWLAVNLCTAFVASRVIGMFENSIEKIVALATLMPIVAGIGGNSGNQTITMIVRAMTSGQISNSQAWRLLRKEEGVALVNGIIWGSVMGIVSYFLYHSVGIGLVMVAAMTLNLLLAATVGVLIPVCMQKAGRDPALGSSVLITAVTDSGGFFIFLGLATLFLL
ncbi:magnesium transporter [Snodgrassella alvi]|jgi:magnesium transporter|uniref:Magnesium transporter MgtE n=1 Tax=Snodgrassella alvi TaxID=1196083 RepID=A0A2N9X080_9NEIS|nr:magnesium transporter [Snodgrassella alvi]PIT07849.1 magnesium transporter [Snodgrassella alvi]PIT24979.1 magnesium transporter [Snodgrassella alvi]PIT43535.1 magnesium transporter [Snodgrassella alvi]PIT53595.1 magnesium transporter [Snodgrassella alvi]PIT55745.1 magnesium transporter [Snodgrassella alvi]